MNEEQKEEINSYKIQIVLLFIVLIALIIAFTYLKDLINRVKYNYPSKSDLYKKNYLLSSIFVFLSFGYIIIAYRNYQKRRDNEAFLSLIESILLTIASLVRLYNVKKNQGRWKDEMCISELWDI